MAKQKTTVKKPVKQPEKKDVKVLMLVSLQILVKGVMVYLPEGSTQLITKKQAGFWENPKRNYVKRV